MIPFIANPTELVGAMPLHLACARPLCRLKAPLGLLLPRLRWGRAVQVLLSAEDVSRKVLCEYRFNQRGTGDSPAAVVLLLDIPRGWKPRAKQQPTGLIACGAAHRRPVQVLFRTEKKKQNTNVFCFFLVRVVIQNFSKTIVVQFVFETIG